MNQYVFIGFVVVIAGILIFFILNPTPKLGNKLVIDDEKILIHNGSKARFTTGANNFFKDKTIRSVKPMFDQKLSDGTQ